MAQVNDSDLNRYALREYVNEILQRDPIAGRNFEAFISKLFSIFGDKPGVSWIVRAGAYPCPVFRIYNRQTRRTKAFLYFWEGRLEILRDFVSKEYADLFPIKKQMYGATDGVTFDCSLFDEDEQEVYAEAIRAIVHGRNDIRAV